MLWRRSVGGRNRRYWRHRAYTSPVANGDAGLLKWGHENRSPRVLGISSGDSAVCDWSRAAEYHFHLCRRFGLCRIERYGGDGDQDAADRLARGEWSSILRQLRNRVRVQPKSSGAADRPVSAAVWVRRERGGASPR